MRQRVTLPAVVALGSNQGNREANIRAAVAEIDALRAVRVTGASSLYETPALTFEGIDESAPRYLNAVIMTRVGLAPHDFLSELHRIEESLGRVRAERWGDRTIDLDIVDFGHLTIDEPGLTLPHPRAAQRAFVLAPLLELVPDAELPGYGAVADLLASASDPVAVFPSEPLFPLHWDGVE